MTGPSSPLRAVLIFLAGPEKGCALRSNGVVIATCDAEGGQEAVMHRSTRQLLQATGHDLQTITFYMHGEALLIPQDIIAKALRLAPGQRVAPDDIKTLIRLAHQCPPDGIRRERDGITMIREQWPAWRN